MPYDPRTWLSASKWKAVSQCGERYRLERVEKRPSRPAAWTVRGNAVHETVEKWEASGRELDPEKYFNEEAWPKALEETKDKYPELRHWQRTPRVSSVPRDIELRKADGLGQVLRYCERATAEEDLWRVIAVEQSFELDFPDILVRGYIDQIREWNDGELSVWDIKTGGDDSEDNRQLGLYGLGYQGLHPDQSAIAFGSYWYTKLDRASRAVDLSIYTYEYVNQELQKVKKILDQGLFLANPSINNCKFCGVSEFCKEAKA